MMAIDLMIIETRGKKSHESFKKTCRPINPHNYMMVPDILKNEVFLDRQWLKQYYVRVITHQLRIIS